MSNDFDINAVAADVTVSIVKESLAATFQKITRLAKVTYAKFFTDFESHTLNLHQRISSVKLITSRDHPVPFSHVYTSSGFRCDNSVYSDSALVDVLLSGKRCVLSGNGGAGKTFMMRYIWLEVFKRKNDRVPVLVELRKLNSLSTYDVISFIRANSFGGADIDEATFQRFCEQGAFVFLLDGFDEVVREKRDDLEQKILEVSRRFPNCGLIVSGRPDDRFGSWADFYSFRSEPFSFKKFRELISKVPFDQEIKKSFLRVANEDFFDKHQSFLSNPLLSLMMLLTFRDNAEIPSRLSTFYDLCFSTLYSQHDSLKESFSRKKTLDQLKFKRLFSAFSLVTYLATRPSVSGDEYINAIEKAKKIAGVESAVDDISHDFLESVNLIVKEGDTYSFIHRSFQEFFAAYCVANVISSKQQSEILAKISKRRYDNTLKLCYELHPKLVEGALILPRYKALLDAGCLSRRRAKDSPFNCCAKSGLSVHLQFGHVSEPDGARNAVLLHRLSIKWLDDYEVITPAVAIAKDNINVSTRSFFERVMKLLVIDSINFAERATSQEEMVSDFSDLKFGETVEFSVTFSDEKPELKIEGDDASRNPFVSRYLSAFQNSFFEKVGEVESAILENNKAIVATCQAILLDSVLHETVLGDILI